MFIVESHFERSGWLYQSRATMDFASIRPYCILHPELLFFYEASYRLNFNLYYLEALQSHTDKPDFSTLTGIMNRFYSVPYTQFQCELDEWFQKGLLSNGIEFNYFLNNDSGHLPPLLDQLVSQIYERAEQQNCQQNGGQPDV